MLKTLVVLFYFKNLFVDYFALRCCLIIFLKVAKGEVLAEIAYIRASNVQKNKNRLIFFNYITNFSSFFEEFLN
jgi:hypothetical protein